jgi:hypothetical protein
MMSIKAHVRIHEMFGVRVYYWVLKGNSLTTQSFWETRDGELVGVIVPGSTPYPAGACRFLDLLGHYNRQGCLREVILDDED